MYGQSRQTGKKWRVMRIDQGRKFNNNIVQEWACSHGITLELTTAYSLAANNVAKRKHCSTFLRTSSIPLGVCSSIHSFLGIKVDVRHFHAFGTKGFAMIVDASLGKWDSRVREDKMIGYGNDTGSYILYVPGPGKMISETLAGSQDSESALGEQQAQISKEDWATNSKQPRRRMGNLAITLEGHAKIDNTYNAAMTTIQVGIPPVPKGYKRAMEDEGRCLPAVEKEKERMEFKVFGDAQYPPSGTTVLVVLWVFAQDGWRWKHCR
ncbi:hypothetical protein K435DRAFT_794188 [Dendrothele bispora CBS 962.96]|uniref:Integrase catalytic domain-containing protein n=1 Tax=Dendrothele bispora (strain CBS 962.96) TaxID=1314807 RepID=A0A4S8MD22_DENBC|nr:hypothetical protein K435DRAFT_794188 [Dendrothele bispora CBS 962.96]